MQTTPGSILGICIHKDPGYQDCGVSANSNMQQTCSLLVPWHVRMHSKRVHIVDKDPDLTLVKTLCESLASSRAERERETQT